MTIDSAMGIMPYQQPQQVVQQSAQEGGVASEGGVAPMQAQNPQEPSEEAKKMVAESTGVGGTLNISA